VTVKRATWGEGDGKRETWASTFYTPDGKRRRKQGFSTRKAAENWEREEFKRLEHVAASPSDTPIDISAVCDDWLVASEQGLGERTALESGTIDDYELSVRLYIKPHLGTRIVSSITTPDIVNFRKTLLSVTTRKKAQRVLRHLRIAFNYAMEIGYIQFNPAQTVKIALDKREDTRIKIPTRAEMMLILGGLDDRANLELAKTPVDSPWLRFAALFRALQGGGLRVSEARGLSWDSVNLDLAVITINQRADRGGKIGKVKSKAAYRDVVVGENVIRWLRLWKTRCPASEAGLVFPTRDGKALLYSNMYKLWWLPLCRDLKLVDDTNTPLYAFHSARHFRASEMIAVGANVKEIMNEIGHATSAMTLDLYGHLFPEDLAKRREQSAEIDRKLVAKETP
jgi:integrase